MRRHALVAVTLLVLAGCATPLAPLDRGGSSGAAAPENVPDTATTRPSSTASSVGPQSANPWGTSPVVVAVRDEGGSDRAFAPMVREATEFWTERDERYLGFPVRYTVRPDASNPDLVVTFADEVPDCGAVSDAVGCAPLLTDPRQVERPETVWVETGLSDNSTVLVTKHELGHTLGLTHADRPQSVMRAESVLYTEPRPNATERSFPWDDGAFTVQVDVGNATDAGNQVDHALTYYAEGAPGMPTNLTFRRVDREAEIHIRIGDDGACGASQGSCVSTYGADPDGDGAIETYSRVEISLVGIDADAVGWHVGYWLAHVLGAEADAEKPPPFREASPRERRSAWWE